MRGSVFRRCQCRDGDGKRVKNCRKSHGSWSFTVDAGTDPRTGKRRQITRSGFKTKAEAEDALTDELAKLNAGTWTDDRRMTPWLNILLIAACLAAATASVRWFSGNNAASHVAAGAG